MQKPVSHKPIQSITLLNYETSTFSIDENTFRFKRGPHLDEGHKDWHTAYIPTVDRIFAELADPTKEIDVPNYPLQSIYSGRDLLLEMGAYWEGALYYLQKIEEENTHYDCLGVLEYSLEAGHGTIEEFLFMHIWNSQGQIKWLKAFLTKVHLARSGYEFDESPRELLGKTENHWEDRLLWLDAFITQHKVEGKKYPNPYFGGANPLHLSVHTLNG